MWSLTRVWFAARAVTFTQFARLIDRAMTSAKKESIDTGSNSFFLSTNYTIITARLSNLIPIVFVTPRLFYNNYITTRDSRLFPDNSNSMSAYRNYVFTSHKSKIESYIELENTKQKIVLHARSHNLTSLPLRKYDVVFNGKNQFFFDE